MGSSRTLLTPAMQMSRAIETRKWSDVARLASLHGPALANVAVSGTTSRPLHYVAAYDDDATAVTALLRSGADANMQRLDGATALHVAAKNGNAAAVDALLANDADVDPVSANGYTPLLDAVENKRRDVVIMLLNAGAAVNYGTPTGSSKGHTALHCAARQGHVEEADLLLARGAAMDVAVGAHGFTPLKEACSGGHTAVVELLLDRGAAMDFAGSFCDNTPLMEACSSGHTAVVELLLDRGAAMDVAGGSQGFTPLIEACWRGHAEIVEVLLAKGASVQVVSKKSRVTALHVATAGRFDDLVYMLVAHGADPGAVNSKGETPLSLLATDPVNHRRMVEARVAYENRKREEDVPSPLVDSQSPSQSKPSITHQPSQVHQFCVTGPDALSAPLTSSDGDNSRAPKVVDEKRVEMNDMRNRPELLEGKHVTEREHIDPDTCVASDQSMAFDGRPSVPMVSLAHDLDKVPPDVLKDDRQRTDLRSLMGGTKSAVMVQGTGHCNELEDVVDEREVRDEMLLKYLEEYFHVWIRKLQSGSSGISESEKLETIAKMNAVWNGWAISPHDVTFEKDAFGVPFKVGSGKSGNVYRGSMFFDGELVRVAIKQLEDDVAVGMNRITFVREVMLLHRASHPNIVEFRGAFWPGQETLNRAHSESSPGFRSYSTLEKPFVATELMTTNLKKFRASGFLSQFESQLRVIVSVARALDYLHGERIVHQDVSPDNVLLRLADDGRILDVKVTDLGVSRVIRHTESRTKTNECMAGAGKYDYMAPEALLRNRRLDFSVDVWSFGALCAFAVLGKTANEGLTDFQVCQSVHDGSLSTRCMEWATRIGCAGLREICVSCMSEEPTSRPSMRLIRRELEDLLANGADLQENLAP